MLNLMASFAVNCSFLFPNFVRSAMEKIDFHKPPRALALTASGKVEKIPIMNLYLKKEGLYLKIAWIKRMDNGSIIGWNMSINHSIENFPKDVSYIDIHYHYPVKGKFHYSYKYKFQNLEYHVRAYKNELNMKVIGNILDIQTNQIHLPFIEKFKELFILNSLEDIQYDNPDYFKQLMATGFKICTDRVADDIKNQGKKKGKIKDDDIVLDVDILGKVSISYGPVVYNNKGAVNFNHLQNEQHFRYTDESRNPIIDFIVSVFPSTGE